MQKANRFGLARNIPNSVKRAVRQRCGFGCVVCGCPFIQYHHADVQYSDATSHDPNKITLLCGTCHDRVSRGTYSAEKIKEHMLRPYCLEHGPAFTDLDYGATAPKFRFAGSDFDDVSIPVRVMDYAVFMLEKPPETGSPVLISAFFTNTRGEVSLVINRNNVLMRPTNWDVAMEGTRIRIWDAERKPSLTLNMVPRQHIEVEKFESTFLGWKFSGDKEELSIWSPGEKDPNVIVGMRLSRFNIGFQFGKATFR